MFRPTTSTLLALALLAAPLLASAQRLADNVPLCALPCVQSAADNVDCNPDLSDRACLCRNIVGFSTSAFLCASTSPDAGCTRGDLGSLNGALSSVCSGPPPSAPGSGSASGSASAPASASQTTAIVISTHSTPAPPASASGSTQPTPENTTTVRVTPPTTTGTPSVTPTLNTPAPVIPSPATPSLTPLSLNNGALASDSASSTVVLMQTVVLPQGTSGASSVMRGSIGGGAGLVGVVVSVGAMVLGGLVM